MVMCISMLLILCWGGILTCTDQVELRTGSARRLFAFSFSRGAVPQLAFPKRETVCDACQGAAWELLDGHTLRPAITKLKKLTGVETRRIHVDKISRAQSPTEVPRVDHPADAPHHRLDPTRNEAPRGSPCNVAEAGLHPYFG
jgi:hypothetical protein